MTAALTLDNVTAGYRHKPILHAIAAQLDEGAMTSVIGPNGAGKTTLMRVITGLIRPTGGQVTLFGRRPGDIAPRERAALVGVVPQSVEVPVAFSVAEIVMLGRTRMLSQWRGPGREDDKAVERAMAYADVTDLRDQPFCELSGGEKQRVIIAMVLAQQPRLILMDEATSHLDINHRIEIMQIIERLNTEHGTTVLMISHDLNLAAEFSRRMILLDRGRIVADGPPREVLTREILSRVYNCEVCVQQNATGNGVTVTPAPRLVAARTGRGLHVHVIAGGGAGEEIMRRLLLAEYRVSVGVLNEGDSDARTAHALDIATVLEKPFSPVAASSLARAATVSQNADVVVVSGMPFGTGNVPNLDLAEAALQRGAVVLVQSGVEARDYTPDGDAARRTAVLLTRGAVAFDTITDLFRMLPGALPPAPAPKQRGAARIGTTSYIIPAGILANVRALAPRIDDVELVIFESDAISNLPPPDVVAALRELAAEHALTYTVHLPMDVRLGAVDEQVRQASVAACLRVIERMAPLAPAAWVTHLAIGDYPGPTSLSAPELDAWRAATRRSVTELLAAGITPRTLCVENLAYPFEYAVPIIEAADLGICVDIGHLLLGGCAVPAHLDRFWPRTRVLHLSGIRDGRDHSDLSHLAPDILRDLFERIAATPVPERILTVEVFSSQDFTASCHVLEEYLP
jgi:iron complex transport system ATP-binding protein